MSLLNNMLRDLSHQQKLLAKSTSDNHDLLQQTTLLKKSPAHWLPIIIIFVVVFSVVMGAKYFLYSFGIVNAKKAHENASPSVVANAQVNSVINTAVEKANTESAPLKPTSINAEEKSIAEVESSAQLNAQINDLLQQANRALAVDKLTSPIEDNAYAYFQKILIFEPNHLLAKKGLELIAARYLIKAREQLALGNREQSDTFIRRAHFVAPEYVKSHDSMSVEQASDTAVSTTIAPEPHAREAEVVSIITPPVIDAAPISVPHSENLSSAATFNSEVAKSESIKPFVVTESVPVNIVPNAAWKDEQLAEQASHVKEVRLA